MHWAKGTLAVGHVQAVERLRLRQSPEKGKGRGGEGWKEKEDGFGLTPTLCGTLSLGTHL